MNEPDIPDAELVALARQLGERAAGQIDPAQTAVAVLKRLRQAPKVHRPLQPWLALAASLVLLVAGGTVVRQLSHRTSAVAAPVAVDVSDLSAPQLGEVMNGLERTDVNAVDEDPPSIEAGIEQLTPTELRSLLKSLTS
ncbi:MAG TPA: hypothetical protein VN848_07330 [Gemmatimonadales bacterium]|nr:hypothetical protein [Gemmatimonadales bacterium]